MERCHCSRLIFFINACSISDSNISVSNSDTCGQSKCIRVGTQGPSFCKQYTCRCSKSAADLLPRSHQTDISMRSHRLPWLTSLLQVVNGLCAISLPSLFINELDVNCFNDCGLPEREFRSPRREDRKPQRFVSFCVSTVLKSSGFVPSNSQPYQGRSNCSLGTFVTFH